MYAQGSCVRSLSPPPNATILEGVTYVRPSTMVWHSKESFARLGPLIFEMIVFRNAKIKNLCYKLTSLRYSVTAISNRLSQYLSGVTSLRTSVSFSILQRAWSRRDRHSLFTRISYLMSPVLRGQWPHGRSFYDQERADGLWAWDSIEIWTLGATAVQAIQRAPCWKALVLLGTYILRSMMTLTLSPGLVSTLCSPHSILRKV